jgi:hypothetical protein
MYEFHHAPIRVLLNYFQQTVRQLLQQMHEKALHLKYNLLCSLSV